MVDDVMSALGRYGYVDDEDFARRFAERRAAAGKSGARLLKMELRAKGIQDRETIDRAGAWMTAGVLTGLDPESDVAKEVIFGPVAAVYKARDLDEPAVFRVRKVLRGA